jgi:methanogen homocitrate synthase
VIKKPLAMFATDPALFGKHSDVALGKKSGRPNVTYHLDELGLAATDEQVGEILARVKEMGIKKKRLLSLEEFKEIASACGVTRRASSCG